MKYYATFYSHFGAIQFHKLCVNNEIEAIVKPVPRAISSSCGSCVEFNMEQEPLTVFTDIDLDDVEKLVVALEGKYEVIFDNTD
ncbi:MAG: DUF3343 domain-containing protein [Tissierellia bacterium]|nr:DUF3343 domain-containing protein [Tissierellia bacterium]